MLEITEFVANQFDSLSEAQREEVCREAGVFDEYLYQTTQGHSGSGALDSAFAELYDKQRRGEIGGVYKRYRRLESLLNRRVLRPRR